MTDDNTPAIPDLPPSAFREPMMFRAARKWLGFSLTEMGEALLLENPGKAARKYETGNREISGPITGLLWFIIQHGMPDCFHD